MRRGVLNSMLLLAMLVVIASAQSSSGSTSASIFANSTISNSSSSSRPKTQCEICRDGGDCSKAYRGAVGQFYNTWIQAFSDPKACCCPASDVCTSISNYKCTCEPIIDNNFGFWIWIGLGVFILSALFAGGIIMRKRRMQRGREYPPGPVVTYIVQPVYTQGGYAQQGCAPGTYTQPVNAQGGYVRPS